MLPILNTSLLERKLKLAEAQISEGNTTDAEGTARAIFETLADFNAGHRCGHWFAAVLGSEETGLRGHKCENCGRNLRQMPGGRLELTEEELLEDAEAHVAELERQGDEISAQAERDGEED